MFLANTVRPIDSEIIIMLYLKILLMVVFSLSMMRHENQGIGDLEVIHGQEVSIKGYGKSFLGSFSLSLGCCLLVTSSYFFSIY